jgi:hypothetical protein
MHEGNMNKWDAATTEANNLWKTVFQNMSYIEMIKMLNGRHRNALVLFNLDFYARNNMISNWLSKYKDEIIDVLNALTMINTMNAIKLHKLISNKSPDIAAFYNASNFANEIEDYFKSLD